METNTVLCNKLETFNKKLSSYQKAEIKIIRTTLWDNIKFLKDILIWTIILVYFVLQSLFYIIFVKTKRKKIAGKVVLITGSGKKLGREIAYAIAKEKCTIAVACS